MSNTQQNTQLKWPAQRTASIDKTTQIVTDETVDKITSKHADKISSGKTRSDSKTTVKNAAADIEMKIIELESKLCNIDLYDFNGIFEVLKSYEEIYLPQLSAVSCTTQIESLSDQLMIADIIAKKVENIKAFVYGELIDKFGTGRVIQKFPDDKIFKIESLNVDLTNIDKYLGTSLRTRLVKKFVDINSKLQKSEGTLQLQLIAYIGWFFDLMKIINASKFPDSWEIYYEFFISFRKQLKTLIRSYLSTLQIKDDSDTQALLANIKTISKFEDEVKNVLRESNCVHTLSIDDSIINLFENSLLSFLDNVKKEMASLTMQKIESFEQSNFKIPDSRDIQIDSYKIIPSNPTIEIISDFNTLMTKCNKYSTGIIYSTLIKGIFEQLKKYSASLLSTYTAKRTTKSYDIDTEYLMFNIIFNIFYCSETVVQMMNNTDGKIQTKYVPNAEFNAATDFFNKQIMLCVDTWVDETCSMLSKQFVRISGLKFDKENEKIVGEKVREYSNVVCTKYLSACRRVHKYLPELWAQYMSEKITYGVIDMFISHILKLRNVNKCCCQYLDAIVTNMVQATKKSTDEKLINEHKICDSFNGEPVEFQSYVATKITQIQTILNAISVDNNLYTESRHILEFNNGFSVPYNIMVLVKGCISVTNIHVVAKKTIGDGVEGGINMAGELARFVTGKDDDTSNGSLHGSGKSTIPPPTYTTKNDSKHDDDTFMAMPNMPNMSKMVGDAKKMFGGISLSLNSKKDTQKETLIKK